MKIVVNLHSLEEEKDFVILTSEQENEIIRRDNAFAQGKTDARNRDDIIRDLENVYR